MINHCPLSGNGYKQQCKFVLAASPLASPGDSAISEDLSHQFMGKCPLKLQFPTFDRMEYLDRCKDYLTFNTVLDEDLMVTFKNMFYGAAKG